MLSLQNIENKVMELENVVLVGLIHSNQDEERTNEYLDELSFLAETAGGKEIKRFLQSLPQPNPKTYIGRGKLEEIAIFVEENNVHTIIFDD